MRRVASDAERRVAQRSAAQRVEAAHARRKSASCALHVTHCDSSALATRCTRTSALSPRGAPALSVSTPLMAFSSCPVCLPGASSGSLWWSVCRCRLSVQRLLRVPAGSLQVDESMTGRAAEGVGALSADVVFTTPVHFVNLFFYLFFYLFFQLFFFVSEISPVSSLSALGLTTGIVMFSWF